MAIQPHLFSYYLGDSFPIKEAPGSSTEKTSLKTLSKNEDFNAFELTKLLTSTQRDSILKQPISSEQVSLFSEQIHSKDGINLIHNNVLDNHKILPQIALRARFQGSISDDQFSSLCLLYQGIEQFIHHRVSITQHHLKVSEGLWKPDFEIHPLPPAKNPKDLFSVHYLFDDMDQKEVDRLLASFMALSPLELEEFKKNLHEAPLSEQYFYTFKIPMGDVISWSMMYRGICDDLDLWHPVDDNNSPPPSHHDWKQKLFVLPSYTMFQQMLNVKYRENSVKLRSVLGKCTPLTIEEYKLKGERIFNIGMPDGDVSETSHGQYAGKLMFTLHDAYHSVRESLVPNNYKSAMLRVNEIFKKILERSPKNKGLKHLKWLFIDGEIFDNKTDKFGVIFTIKPSLWKMDFAKEVVLKDMCTNKELWKKEFNITKKDLLPEERKLYDKISKQIPSKPSKKGHIPAKTILKTVGAIAITTLLSIKIITKVMKP